MVTPDGNPLIIISINYHETHNQLPSLSPTLGWNDVKKQTLNSREGMVKERFEPLRVHLVIFNPENLCYLNYKKCLFSFFIS